MLNLFLKSKTFYFLRLSQFAIAAIIFTTAALMPASRITLQQSDTTLHMLGNFLLFTSAWLASYHRIRIRSLIILLTLYSMLIEAAQALVPSRTVDINDAYANISGLLLGLCICVLIRYIIERKQPHALSLQTR